MSVRAWAMPRPAVFLLINQFRDDLFRSTRGTEIRKSQDRFTISPKLILILQVPTSKNVSCVGRSM